MAETINYQLYITDDDETLFKDWREQINGTSNSNMTKIDSALSDKAQKSISAEATLLATGWTGEEAPFTQNITVEHMTAEQNGSAAVAQDATPDQMKAAENAGLRVTGQIDGVLTISCYGEKPEIDIPVSITLLG